MCERVKISVALAACDGEKFIRRQLESILRQSVPADEILIGDDSGSSGTHDAIAELLKTNLHIRYFRHEKPLGAAENFASLLSMASGEIIFLSDQDDEWEADKIEKMTAFLRRRPECCGVFSDSEAVDPEGRPLGFSHWEMRNFRPREEVVGQAEFLRRVPLSGHDTAIRREMLGRLLPFPPLANCHDSWIGLVGAATSRWGCVREKLTRYTIHENNLSRPSKPTLRWKFAQAASSVRNNSFVWTEELFAALIERCGESAALKERLRYTSSRKRMGVNVFRRLPLICGELFSGRYFRFGHGWKSVAQDLLLRPAFGTRSLSSGDCK